jgi:hypothetical protein
LLVDKNQVFGKLIFQLFCSILKSRPQLEPAKHKGVFKNIKVEVLIALHQLAN